MDAFLKKKTKRNCGALRERLFLIQMLLMMFWSLALHSTFMSLKSVGGHNSALEDQDQAMLRMKRALQNKVMEPVSG